MSARPQVFIVTKPEFNLSEATHWGDPRIVNERYIFGDDVLMKELPGEFLEHLRQAALEFTPQFDYLMIAGDHLQLAVFTSYLTRYYNYYRVLRYDRKAKGYWDATVYPFGGTARNVIHMGIPSRN